MTRVTPVGCLTHKIGGHTACMLAAVWPKIDAHKTQLNVDMDHHLKGTNMKKRVLLFALLIAAMAVPALAQVKLGVTGSATLSDLHVKNLSNSLSLSDRSAFRAGLVAELPLSNALSLQVEGAYSQKGALIASSEPGDENLDASIRSAYIEVPVLLKATLKKGQWQPFLIAGPVVALPVDVDMRVENAGFTLQGDMDFLTKSPDFGLIGGGGIAYSFDRLTLYGEARNFFGLADIFKAGEVPITDGTVNDSVILEEDSEKNRGFQLSVGVLFQL